MIDWMDEEGRAVEFVKERLVKVKDLLDEIAMETGQVYVAMPLGIIGSFATLGARWGSWILEAQKVCADRILVATAHDDWMVGRHGEDLRKKPEQDKAAEGKKLTPADIATSVPEDDRPVGC